MVAAKEEFADAVANGGGIYIVGYCIGAKYALLLGADKSDSGSEPSESAATKKTDVKAVAIAHGKYHRHHLQGFSNSTRNHDLSLRLREAQRSDNDRICW